MPLVMYAADPTTTPALGVQLRAVHRTFTSPRPLPVIDGVTLDVAPGDFLSLLGPSGCGKSTLLRLIAGLDRPDSGEIALAQDGNPLAAKQAHADGAVGFVFQDAQLLPWRTALDNVALPLEFRSLPTPGSAGGFSHPRAAAAEALARVGLTDAADRYPAQLSGGMRMRVSLARALVTRPRLLLMDEPFAALDEITRQSLDEDLRKLWSETGATIIFVTHSMTEAAYLAQRVVVFTPRPARVQLDHAIDLPADRPADLRFDPCFAQQVQLLRDALRAGGAI
jgi:NitT/TauT family transport system ATP-binding protein